jgi:hypothetical protein
MFQEELERNSAIITKECFGGTDHDSKECNMEVG